MKKLYSPTNYKDINFMRFPAIVLPKVYGLRLLARYNDDTDSTNLFNHKGEYEFKKISRQLNTLLRLHPRVVTDGIISIRGLKQSEIIQALADYFDGDTTIEFHYYVMDTFVENSNVTGSLKLINIRGESRLPLHNLFKAYCEGNKGFYLIKVLPYAKVGDKHSLEKLNNKYVKEGYSGSFVRKITQASPFAESNKFDFIKIEGKI